MPDQASPKRADADAMIPSTSPIVEVSSQDILTDPITLEIESEKPVSFMEDPEQIVPHESVPAKLRTAIIETYGEKFFLDREWTRGQLKRLHTAIFKPRHNLSNAIAQVCSGSCAMKDHCPYDIAGFPPAGERCPIELAYAKRTYDAYLAAVAEQYGANANLLKDNIIVHNLINGLVEADMVELRLNNTIAHDGFEVQVPTAVNENTGDVYYRDEESVSVRIKERVARRKDMLFRQLLATPEMAAKYKRKESSDLVARQSQALDSLEKLVKSIQAAQTAVAPTEPPEPKVG